MRGFYLLRKGDEIIYEGYEWKQVRQVLNSAQPPLRTGQFPIEKDVYVLSAIKIERGRANMVYREYSISAIGAKIKIEREHNQEIRGMPPKDLERILEGCKQIARQY